MRDRVFRPSGGTCRNRPTFVRPASLLALLLLVGPLPVRAEWSQWLGGAERANAATALAAAPRELRTVWEITLGPGYSAVTAAGDRYVVMYADRRHDRLAALDANTGDVLWSTEVGRRNPGKDTSADGPLSTPAVLFSLGVSRGEDTVSSFPWW